MCRMVLFHFGFCARFLVTGFLVFDFTGFLVFDYYISVCVVPV